MNLLVFGATGQVAWELRRSLSPLGRVHAVGKGQCDLRIAGRAREAIESLRPDVVVVASAYTAVDAAEDDRATAQRLNGDALGEIGLASKNVGAVVVHYSTDYVFSGDSPMPYAEDSPTGPKSVYGETKLLGEQLLRDSGAAHLIFRTSWVYGARGKNFVLTILRAAGQRTVLRVVNDQHGSPTWSRSIAEATAHVLARASALGTLSEVLAVRGGVYHLTAAGHTTWFEFATRLCEWLAARNAEAQVAIVEPTSTEAYGARAPRPANSLLDCSRLARDWSICLPAWQSDLDLVLAEIAER